MTTDGETYPTIEHAFQAAKTLNLEDRRRIRMESTPGPTKRLGRRSTLRPDWEKIKGGVMLELVRQEFTTHPDLATRLLATGHAEIIETNHWGDTIWGVCDGIGENKLGEILMQVRSELRVLVEES
ncbi:MAG: NADAR family protein [Solirubrobacterales bacterium]|nr:NADAR family protein [Solirubrobacterales bacterium]